jgi:hypothetical protein
MDQNEPSLATRVLRDVDPWLLLEVALVVLAATAAVIVIERATAFLAERARAVSDLTESAQIPKRLGM